MWFFHKQLGSEPAALDSFPVISLLPAADLSMKMQPLGWLPILPNLLHQLCSLKDCLGQLGKSA